MADDTAPQVAADQPTTLRLSEVLPDAIEPGNDAPYEWIELVNVGPEPVDTAGWRIGDNHSSDPLPSVVIQPGAYLVVAGALAAIPGEVPVVRLADGRIGNGLNNLGEVVTLTAPNGTTVDQMAYGEAGGVEAPGPGETVGVIIDAAKAGNSDAWMLTSKLTPGLPNEFPADSAVQPVAAPTEPSTGNVPEAARPVASPPASGKQKAVPAVTERENRSTIPLFILIAAVGAGLGGFAVRHGPALVRLKDRITRRA